MITPNQATQILSIFDKASEIARTTGIAMKTTEIMEELKKVEVSMTAEEYNVIRNNFEMWELKKATHMWYSWVASGMFKNKMIYSPINTASLIDAYNKTVKH